MPRSIAITLTLLLLAGACAPRADAPSATAAASGGAASAAATTGNTDPLPPPLLSTHTGVAGTEANTLEVCQKQCERGFSICMDGTAARSDVTSGTMYEARMFGPAAQCERSLSSCIKRCGSSSR